MTGSSRASVATPPHVTATWRRLPVGAEVAPDGGVHFRVWAPDHERVEVVLLDERGEPLSGHRLNLEGAEGYWSGLVEEARRGTRYKLRIGDDGPFPDPASRWQPEGVHGPSVVVDPTAYRWTDDAWRGVPADRHVIYELHIGTFTPEGTWAAAERELPRLVDLGITTLEVMPVAEFPGRFGWGYDGVALFAPTRLYGTPDDMRHFVDTAHRHGLAVILDVVYNHFGPDGAYLNAFSKHYVSTKHATDWGGALNFDGERSGPVREFIVANAGYWVDEFHCDGLRLDATHVIFDDTRPHVLAEVGARVRAKGGRRHTYVVNENEAQRSELVRPVSAGGMALDAIWNDDFHHASRVALTGRDEAYFTDYRGTPQEFVSAARHAFLFQGQWYKWQGQRRGTSSRGVEPWRFVHFLQNHDQVANATPNGQRVHLFSSPSRLRAMTALLLLGPQTPMLFQGQEYQAPQPFLYFADHNEELAPLVEKGRHAEIQQFPSSALPDTQALFPAPQAEETFRRCVLDPRDRAGREHVVALHRDLIRLRREDPVFSRPTLGGVDGAVLGTHAFVLRFFGERDDDRLLVVNLGPTLHLDVVPEPLLAPPAGMRWEVRWSSEATAYGGLGMPPVDAAEAPRSPEVNEKLVWPWENWRITGESAAVLAPTPAARTTNGSRH